MKRTFAALALLFALAAPAYATSSYYINFDSGSDLNSGADNAHAWLTVNRANGVVGPGDIVHIASDSASPQSGDAINPARDGTASAYITYIGDSDNESVDMAGPLNLTRNYISVRNGGGNTFAFTSISFGSRDNRTEAASFDSVSWLYVYGGISFGYAAVPPRDELARDPQNTSSSNVIYHNSFVGGADEGFWCDCRGDDCAKNRGRSRSNVLRGNTMTFPRSGDGDRHGWFMRGASGWVIDSNTVTLSQAASSTGSFRKLYYCQNNLWSDNHWKISETRTLSGGKTYYFYQRDSTCFNIATRDTFDVKSSSTSGVELLLEASGNTALNGRSGHNKWDRCVWRNPVNTGPYFKDAMNEDTLTYCTVASLGQAFSVDQNITGACVIDHCTFADSSASSTVALLGGPGSDGFIGSLAFTNNLVYRKRKGGAVYAAYHRLRNGNLTSDYNFFSHQDSIATTGDECVGFADCTPTLNCLATQRSRPDSIPWRTAQGRLYDLHSFFTARAPVGKAGPKFTDSTFYHGVSNYSTFDGSLLANSGPLHLGSGSSNIGSYQSAVDDTVPGTISTLQATQSSNSTIVIEWTAPGDNGTTGTCVGYAIRYSTSAITADNFASASVATNSMNPQVAGSLEVFTVTGLAPSTLYYFAVKGIDEAGNRGAASNSPGRATNGGGNPILDP